MAIRKISNGLSNFLILNSLQTFTYVKNIQLEQSSLTEWESIMKQSTKVNFKFLLQNLHSLNFVCLKSPPLF